MSFDENKVILTGSCVSLPKLREDGHSSIFSLEVMYELKGLNKSIVVPLVAYGRLSEVIQKELVIGSRLKCSGMLRQDKNMNIFVACLEIYLETDKN